MRKLVLSALILSVYPLVGMGQTTVGAWTYIVENGGATITASTATGDVTIPSVLGGYAVKKLGYSWPPIFGNGNTSVTRVVIPSSVTSIAENAFYNCTSLASVTIPNRVTSIGRLAFYRCLGLATFTFEPTSSLTSIGEFAFQTCVNLASISIPSSVTSIGPEAFAECASLASVTFEPTSKVPKIDDNVFYGCRSLTSINLPSSVATIGYQAFKDCRGLASITIPNSVTSIGEFAFGDCFSLASITIPNSVTSIGNNAFAFATILQRVFLPARFEATYQNFSLTSGQVILYDASNLAPIYLAGQQSVIANPNTHNLYTTSQIQNMAVGDLVLNRQVGGGFVLNYDIEKSEDLQSWTTYAPLSLTLTNLPPDKAFIRIKPKQ